MKEKNSLKGMNLMKDCFIAYSWSTYREGARFYETLARHLGYTATGHVPHNIRKARGRDGLFYETDDRLFYLVYEPSLDFLRGAGLRPERRPRRTHRQAGQEQTENRRRLRHPQIHGPKGINGHGDYVLSIAVWYVRDGIVNGYNWKFGPTLR